MVKDDGLAALLDFLSMSPGDLHSSTFNARIRKIRKDSTR
jgi:hypothetical protein